MNPSLDAFLEMLMVERGAARNTILSYALDLNDFAAFAASQGQTLTTAAAATCQAYMASLHTRGLSARTAARRLSALRQFHLFLLREGQRSDDPTSQLDTPKLPQPLPKLLSEAEVDALLAAASRKPGRPGLLARAALELLYATGMRISELLSLSRPALSRDAQSMIIKGKGGKERMVPLSAQAKQAAAALLAETEVVSRWLFPGRNPKSALTRQAFFLLLKQVALEAGVDPARVSPHVLRHSFASHMLARGARPAQPAGAARPCRHRHRPDLHPRGDRAPAQGGRGSPSVIRNPDRVGAPSRDRLKRPTAVADRRPYSSRTIAHHLNAALTANLNKPTLDNSTDRGA